jgi:hypothetical protein
MNPTEGNLKVIMWSKQKAYIVPFNPDESKQDEYFQAGDVEMNGFFPDDIERIYDFGSRQQTAD